MVPSSEPSNSPSCIDEPGWIDPFGKTCVEVAEIVYGNETTDPNDIDNQSPDNFPITYHLNLDDANDLNSSGITSPYESGNATIYYRIQKI